MNLDEGYTSRNKLQNCGFKTFLSREHELVKHERIEKGEILPYLPENVFTSRIYQNNITTKQNAA